MIEINIKRVVVQVTVPLFWMLSIVLHEMFIPQSSFWGTVGFIVCDVTHMFIVLANTVKDFDK